MSPAAAPRLGRRGSVRARAVLGLSLAAAILATAYVISRVALRQATQSGRWVQHTLRVVAEIRALGGDVLEGETGSQGYVLTGRRDFLATYDTAVVHAPLHLNTLRELTADNPVQAARVDTLESLIHRALRFMERGHELRRAGQVDSATALVASGRGKALMDSLRRVAYALEREEESLLHSRTEGMERAITRAQWLLLGGNLLAVLAAGTVVLLLFREARTLGGLIPICASCKKVREDTGYWRQLEAYLHHHADLEFSHGVCPECARRLYGDLADEPAGSGAGAG